jgi:hypothetical protein
VHLQSKVLSPAAEAFRYFVIERGEAFLAEQDRPLLARAVRRRPGAPKARRRGSPPATVVPT